MKFALRILASMGCFLVLFVPSYAQDSPTSSANLSNKTFDISRGLNISHWLSQSPARGEKREKYFTERDIKGASEAGFDHIRIPIDEEQMWDESGDKITEAFTLLHGALRIMQKYDLKAIVDLHIIRAHYFLDESPALFVDAKEQEKFADLWRQLSEELKSYPLDEVAYELLNESVAKEHEDWNRVYRKAYDAVRNIEPNRVIFIGPNRWQSATYFPHLKIPSNDPNIVLSFHFYEPFPITHYRTSWTPMRDYDGPVNYPGVVIDPKDTIGLSLEVRNKIRYFATRPPSDKDELEKAILPALEKAKETGLQLYCGEFGAYASAPEDVRFRWFSDFVSILQKHDIAWTVWDFKSPGFGILNPITYKLRIPRENLFIK